MTKLTIKAYEDDAFSKQKGVFTTLLNPENYSENFKVEYSSEEAIGGVKGNIGYKATTQPNLKLKFLFDGTGVIRTSSGNKPDSVKKQIEDFIEIVHEYNGKIHMPNYLEIRWGDFIFRGKLKELTINYKLFNPDGSPLRAEALIDVEHFKNKEEIQKEKNDNSPDLTHKRTVLAGDTLPLMTESIYGDSKYYLEVAKANGLTHFRRLKPGQEIFFPPIEKTS